MFYVQYTENNAIYTSSLDIYILNVSNIMYDSFEFSITHGLNSPFEFILSESCRLDWQSILKISLYIYRVG